MPSLLSSNKFNKDYYTQIWGTVHRHDYCQSLAEELIGKYGRVRFLDIGTGCAFLVKCLRNLGADAWGLDVSEYAVHNTCAPGYVRQGSVTDIPYASGFDVVFSQGMFEYVEEKDVPRAVIECKRVGNIQVHRIDVDGDPHQKDFSTIRPQSWWDNQLNPKILIACPNHEVKEYAFQRWIDAAHALDYPNKEILVVDNSPSLDFMNRWKRKVPMIHLDPGSKGPNQRIAMSMEFIRHTFLKGDYAYWFNLESDVIVPPDALNVLLKYGDADWVSSYYPARGGTEFQNGFGCSLFSKKLVEHSPFEDAPESTTTDGWWWHTIIKPNVFKLNLKIVELWGPLKIQHLAEGQ